MRNITKILGLGAALAVTGGIAWQALAQAPWHGAPYGMGPGMMMGMHHGQMAGAFADPAARLATLKSELSITAQQQPAWDAYAKAVGEAAAAMIAQRQSMGMHAMYGMSDKDRQAFMTQMAERHQQAFQAFQKVEAAAEKLLAALDDTQKAKAKTTLPGLAQAGPGMMMHPGMGPHGWPHGGMTR